MDGERQRERAGERIENGKGIEREICTVCLIEDKSDEQSSKTM